MLLGLRTFLWTTRFLGVAFLFDESVLCIGNWKKAHGRSPISDHRILGKVGGLVCPKLKRVQGGKADLNQGWFPAPACR